MLQSSGAASKRMLGTLKSRPARSCDYRVLSMVDAGDGDERTVPSEQAVGASPAKA
jgi:hypothetical protein